MHPLLRTTLLLLPLASISLSSCKTSTPYTRMYSPRKSYFIPDTDKDLNAAEAALKANEKPAPTNPILPPGSPPPGAPSIPDIPGIPPAVPPPVAPAPVDPLAPAAAPAAAAPL